MRDVLISEDIRGAAVDALRARFDVVSAPELWRDPAALVAELADFRALMIRNQTPVTAALVARAPELLIVGRAGVGLDNVDVDALNQAGIVLTYTPDQNAISAAELTLGLMLSLVRAIPDAHADTRSGNWNRSRFIGSELYGKTLGIVGAGKIGYLTARRAQAFGMRIVAHDPFLSPDNILLSELRADLLELDDLLAQADIVSCHLPASSATTGLFDAARFACMKGGAYFINTSRGKVVRELDLAAALHSGHLAGAALDVRATEPPLPGALELLPNVILTPHIAAFTQEAQHRVTRAVCDDIARVLEGKPAQNAAGAALPARRAAHV